MRHTPCGMTGIRDRDGARIRWLRPNHERQPMPTDHLKHALADLSTVERLALVRSLHARTDDTPMGTVWLALMLTLVDLVLEERALLAQLDG